MAAFTKITDQDYSHDHLLFAHLTELTLQNFDGNLPTIFSLDAKQFDKHRHLYELAATKLNIGLNVAPSKLSDNRPGQGDKSEN